jgi:hypothetical protein
MDEKLFTVSQFLSLVNYMVLFNKKQVWVEGHFLLEPETLQELIIQFPVFLIAGM